METIFLINRVGSKVRREVRNGREYLVAPLTMIVPGVLPGSDGPLYYPPEEISANYRIWEGQPLVVGHPTRNGLPASAHDIDQKKNWIGNIRKVHISKNGSLRAEGWFDVEKTNRVDNRIITALNRGDLIELSTGLFVEKRPALNGANYKGRSYTHTAHNYRPDHLAILPDQKGACSIQDGCGVLVNDLYTPWQTMKLSINDGWERIENHLPGKHEQKSHGRGGGGGGSGKKGKEMRAYEKSNRAAITKSRDDAIERESSLKSKFVKARDERDAIDRELRQYTNSPNLEDAAKDPRWGTAAKETIGFLLKQRQRLESEISSTISEMASARRDIEKWQNKLTGNTWTPVANTSTKDSECHCGGECEECKEKKLLDNYGNGGSAEQTSKAVHSSCECGKVKCECKPYPKGGKRNVESHKQEVENTWNALDMTPEKACLILKDGTVHGKPITEKQRGLFGARCGQRQKVTKNGGEWSTITHSTMWTPIAINT